MIRVPLTEVIAAGPFYTDVENFQLKFATRSDSVNGPCLCPHIGLETITTLIRDREILRRGRNGRFELPMGSAETSWAWHTHE